MHKVSLLHIFTSWCFRTRTNKYLLSASYWNERIICQIYICMCV